jgi:hypothetical protein
VINHQLQPLSIQATTPDAYLINAYLHDYTLSNLSIWKDFGYGLHTFYDVETNEVLATIRQDGRSDFAVMEINNFPNNYMNFSFLEHDQHDIQEWSNALHLGWKPENHNISFGFTASQVQIERQRNQGSLFTTRETLPRVIGVHAQMPSYESSFYDPILRTFNGRIAQLTHPSGTNVANTFAIQENTNVTNLSVYASEKWLPNSNWTIEWAGRYEWLNINYDWSWMEIVPNFDNIPGGFDGDTTTTYDNIITSNDVYPDYSRQSIFHNFATHIGLRYQHERNTFHVRASYNSQFTDNEWQGFTETTLFYTEEELKLPQIWQAELGMHHDSETGNQFWLTAFYTRRNNVFNRLTLPNFFQTLAYEIESFDEYYYGLEATVDIDFFDWWAFYAHATISRGFNLLTELDLQPYSLQPLYLQNRFKMNRNLEVFLNLTHIGKRYVNPYQVTELPAFQTWDIGITYYNHKHYQVSLEVRNLFNQLGLFSFEGIMNNPILPNLVRQDFKEALPNATLLVQRNQPRGIYMTLKYKL